MPRRPARSTPWRSELIVRHETSFRTKLTRDRIPRLCSDAPSAVERAELAEIKPKRLVESTINISRVQDPPSRRATPPLRPFDTSVKPNPRADGGVSRGWRL